MYGRHNDNGHSFHRLQKFDRFIHYKEVTPNIDVLGIKLDMPESNSFIKLLLFSCCGATSNSFIFSAYSCNVLCRKNDLKKAGGLFAGQPHTPIL
jgi:hypothetical protein